MPHPVDVTAWLAQLTDDQAWLLLPHLERRLTDLAGTWPPVTTRPDPEGGPDQLACPRCGGTTFNDRDLSIRDHDLNTEPNTPTPDFPQPFHGTASLADTHHLDLSPWCLHCQLPLTIPHDLMEPITYQ